MGYKLVTITEHASIDKIKRLQQYAKEFAHSLRFEHVSSFIDNEYFIVYNVDVSEHNKINDLEYTIEEENKKIEQKKQEEAWNNLNIFQKIKTKVCSFLKAVLNYSKDSLDYKSYYYTKKGYGYDDMW
jgi:hypothetical protein